MAFVFLEQITNGNDRDDEKDWNQYEEYCVYSDCCMAWWVTTLAGRSDRMDWWTGFDVVSLRSV